MRETKRGTYATEKIFILSDYLFSVDLVQMNHWLYSIMMIALSFTVATAQQQFIDHKMHHLRNGAEREWSEFPVTAEARQLSTTFHAVINPHAATIHLRQYDVKQPWLVILNDQQIGKLVEDEKDLNNYLQVPPGLIRNGINTLQIKPLNEAAAEPDDIRVGEFSYFPLTVRDLLTQCKISLQLRDKKTKQLLPGKITIINDKGTLQGVHIDTVTHLVSRAGTVYTASGEATFSLPAGNYRFYATRGFEYGVDSARIVLRKADHITKTFFIEREVNTEGWVSCDTHIHTLTYSGHGDATMQERVITIAGEGIEVPVITEHNKAVDIKAAVQKLGLDRWFTPVTGNEVTTARGHFNIFPVDTAATLTDHKSPDWKSLADNIRSASTKQAVILNHAEDIHNNFRPFDPRRHIAVAGMLLEDSVFPANAMEVMNAGSQQQDILKLYHDWFGMMNRGYQLTPVGSSDSHDVNRFMVGQARTYIKAADANPSAINSDEIARPFLEGKVMVSFGLLTRMRVNKEYEPGDLVPAKGKIVVSVEVLGPKWTNAEKIALYANGKKIREASIRTAGNRVIKWKGDWVLPVSSQDIYLVAIAEGAGKDLPFWKIAKPFQKTSPEWKAKFVGSTGAIWIDADNDGKKTSAYDYAKSIVDQPGADIKTIISKLGAYDEPVSIQSAALLWKKGYDLESSVMLEALKQATASTKSGFRLFTSAVLIASSAPSR